jgi:hypothetical protein
MTKFENWPLWLKLVFGIPHVIIYFIAMIWWPQSRKQWLWLAALVIYWFAFYLVFVR